MKKIALLITLSLGVMGCKKQKDCNQKYIDSKNSTYVSNQYHYYLHFKYLLSCDKSSNEFIEVDSATYVQYETDDKYPK